MIKKTRTQFLLIITYISIVAGIFFLFFYSGNKTEKEIKEKTQLLVSTINVTTKDIQLRYKS